MNFPSNLNYDWKITCALMQWKAVMVVNILSNFSFMESCINFEIYRSIFCLYKVEKSEVCQTKQMKFMKQIVEVNEPPWQPASRRLINRETFLVEANTTAMSNLIQSLPCCAWHFQMASFGFPTLLVLSCMAQGRISYGADQFLNMYAQRGIDFWCGCGVIINV